MNLREMARPFDRTRTGRFSIAASILDEDPLSARLILRECDLILHVEPEWQGGSYHFVALSDQFRECEDGELIPQYVWEISRQGRGYSVKALEVEPVAPSVLEEMDEQDMATA